MMAPSDGGKSKDAFGAASILLAAAIRRSDRQGIPWTFDLRASLKSRMSAAQSIFETNFGFVVEIDEALISR